MSRTPKDLAAATSHQADETQAEQTERSGLGDRGPFLQGEGHAVVHVGDDAQLIGLGIRAGKARQEIALVGDHAIVHVDLGGHAIEANIHVGIELDGFEGVVVGNATFKDVLTIESDIGGRADITGDGDMEVIPRTAGLVGDVLIGDFDNWPVVGGRVLTSLKSNQMGIPRLPSNAFTLKVLRSSMTMASSVVSS